MKKPLTCIITSDEGVRITVEYEVREVKVGDVLVNLSTAVNLPLNPIISQDEADYENQLMEWCGQFYLQGVVCKMYATDEKDHHEIKGWREAMLNKEVSVKKNWFIEKFNLILDTVNFIIGRHL
jgi:hypothetical protein